MAKKTKTPAARRLALARRTAALPPVGAGAEQHPLAIIERIAKDRTIDVGKLREVIELQKDLMKTQAKIDFDVAFNQMEPDLPVIVKRGKIRGRNRPVIPFARLDDIHRIVKPILHKHGFSIRHKTEWPKEKPTIVRVVGILTHIKGHREFSAFEGPADTSEYRSHIQSLGSTTSYGRRYTTIDVLNLTIEGQDNDGKDGPDPAPERPPAKQYADPQPQAPAGQHPRNDDKITPRQEERLWRLVANSGRMEQEVTRWLQQRFGFQSANAIRRRDYDFICSCIESPNALPEAKRNG